MNRDESQPVSDSASASVPSDVPADRSSRTPDHPEVSRRLPLWLLTLGSGLLSGLIGWGTGEAIDSRLRMEDEIIYPPNYKSIGGYQKQSVTAEIKKEATQVVNKKKAAIELGMMGLALGVTLGLSGGLSRGTPRTAMTGAAIGGLAGVVAGGVLSWIAVPLFFRFFDPESGMLILFMTHAAIFAGVGAASGMALGLGLGDRRLLARALFGGLIGAFLGTMAFETANALAFPLMRTFEPMPDERIPRVLMYFCVAILTSVGATFAVRKPARKPVADPIS